MANHEANRKPLSKKLRFEIFDRDNFTCQYCGRRPPEVVLEIDHIDPRANGGTNDSINLVTSCDDCNRGKSDRKLGSTSPRPDTDPVYLRAKQEIAEISRYLQAQAELESITQEACAQISAYWSSLTAYTFPGLQASSRPEDSRDLRVFIERYGASLTREAVGIVARKLRARESSGQPMSVQHCLASIGSTLKRLEEECSE